MGWIMIFETIFFTNLETKPSHIFTPGSSISSSCCSEALRIATNTFYFVFKFWDMFGLLLHEVTSPESQVTVIRGFIKLTTLGEKMVFFLR